MHERNAGRERTILCFGDSNTWGYPPGGGERLPADIRWPGALQRLLGKGYHVIEEGLSAHHWLGSCGLLTAAAGPGRPGVLLVCPPPLRASGRDPTEYEAAAPKSRTLGVRFADAAEAIGAELLDLDGVVRYSEEDPMHLDANGQRALAEAVEPVARRLAPEPALTVA